MVNLFSLIKQAIMENYTPTYGEIINEDKVNTFDNAVKNMCSDEEYNQYHDLITSDTRRLLNEAQTQQTFKPKKQNQPITVPGIGDVIQVC